VQIYNYIIFFTSNITSPADNKSKVLASVGEHKIYLSEFSDRYTNYLISTGVKDNMRIRLSILNNMINEILLYYYDSNESIFNNEEYIKELEAAKVRTILAYLKDQDIYSKIEASEEELRETFVKINEKIAVRHLFTQSEEEAYNLFELLKIGVSFESLAESVFTDSVLKKNRGYLGYYAWGELDPAFEDAARYLKIGEISEPVRTDYGYSIIRLEDRVRVPLITEYNFHLKKSQLERQVKIRKKEPFEKEYVENILKENEISFNEESIENILARIKNNNVLTSETSDLNDNKSFAVKVGNKVYSSKEIEENLSLLPHFHFNRINSVNTLKAAIKGILVNEIIYNIALEKGYKTAPPVLKTIEKYRLSTFLKFKSEELTRSIQIDDNILRDYYNEYIHLFSTEDQINLQEILIDRESVAKSLIARLSDGEDFGKLSFEYSLRSREVVDPDGRLGYLPVSQFGNYGRLLWDSELGEIVGPLEADNYFYIFRITGKKEGKPIDFEDIKDEVSDLLKSNTRHLIMMDYIENLRNKVEVQVDENLLASYNIIG
jgi:parvulin-like peptidyl-prolyl isomerase